MTTPTPNPHGTPPRTNPDTGLPMPSPSLAQLALVEELCEDLGRSRDPEDTVRQALLRAVVRQHGRTVRACRADLAAQAAENDRVVADLLADPIDAGGRYRASSITAANTLALGSHALRTTSLRAVTA